MAEKRAFIFCIGVAILFAVYNGNFDEVKIELKPVAIFIGLLLIVHQIVLAMQKK